MEANFVLPVSIIDYCRTPFACKNTKYLFTKEIIVANSGHSPQRFRSYPPIFCEVGITVSI